jgi:hypothetical protein
MRKFMPGKIAIINFQRSLAANAVQALRRERKVATDQDTMYDRPINEAVSREERTLGRIQDESSLVLEAGTEITGRILTVAIYYLSKDQSILRKLRAEFKTVLPSPTSSVTWSTSVSFVVTVAKEPSSKQILFSFPKVKPYRKEHCASLTHLPVQAWWFASKVAQDFANTRSGGARGHAMDITIKLPSLKPLVSSLPLPVDHCPGELVAQKHSPLLARM